MLMLFVNDIHSRPPCLNSNLEETLMCYVSYTIIMQVPVYNEKLMQRWGHSAAPLTISPACIEVVLFGGVQRHHISDTTVLKFGKFLCPS